MRTKNRSMIHKNRAIIRKNRATIRENGSIIRKNGSRITITTTSKNSNCIKQLLFSFSVLKEKHGRK